MQQYKTSQGTNQSSMLSLQRSGHLSRIQKEDNCIIWTLVDLLCTTLLAHPLFPTLCCQLGKLLIFLLTYKTRVNNRLQELEQMRKMDTLGNCEANDMLNNSGMQKIRSR